MEVGEHPGYRPPTQGHHRAMQRMMRKSIVGFALWAVAGAAGISSAQADITVAISPTYVQLVAQQTGKSMDESRKALTEAGGDLARAILILKGQQA